MSCLHLRCTKDDKFWKEIKGYVEEKHKANSAQEHSAEADALSRDAFPKSSYNSSSSAINFVDGNLGHLQNILSVSTPYDKNIIEVRVFIYADAKDMTKDKSVPLTECLLTSKTNRHRWMVPGTALCSADKDNPSSIINHDKAPEDQIIRRVRAVATRIARASLETDTVFDWRVAARHIIPHRLKHNRITYDLTFVLPKGTTFKRHDGDCKLHWISTDKLAKPSSKFWSADLAAPDASGRARVQHAFKVAHESQGDYDKKCPLIAETWEYPMVHFQSLVVKHRLIIAQHQNNKFVQCLTQDKHEFVVEGESIEALRETLLSEKLSAFVPKAAVESWYTDASLEMPTRLHPRTTYFDTKTRFILHSLVVNADNESEGTPATLLHASASTPSLSSTLTVSMKVPPSSSPPLTISPSTIFNNGDKEKEATSAPSATAVSSPSSLKVP